MAHWSQGYSTNTDYTYGFYRELAPSYLKTICRLQGVAEPRGPLTYLELGCGQGLGPNLLAASNPNDTFVGVDFSPEHILGARRLAEAARLRNVTFQEQGFEQLAANPDRIPECDVIALHGVYSWIGPAQREAVRSIIRQKLKTGGLVYLSYNCAAGWGPIANFQKLLRDLALSRGGGFAQTSATLQRLKDLRDAEFGFFKGSPILNRMLDDVSRQDPHYVDHEYMNAYWEPFHFQDVAREMRSCKLTFIGSSSPAENSETLSLSPNLATLFRQEPDPDLRESLKDLHCARRFRKDVYVKGAVRLTTEEWVTALRESSFALIKPRDEVGNTALVPRGRLQMGKASYAQALDLLEQGPSALGHVVSAAPELRDVLTILLQIGAIHPVSGLTADPAAARRLNGFMAGSVSNLTRYNYFASPILGSAIVVNRRLAPAFAAAANGELEEGGEVRVLDRLLADPAYATFYAERPGDSISTGQVKEAFLRNIPIWRSLGILA